MNQDFINWLAAGSNDEKNFSSDGTGLLLAPVNLEPAQEPTPDNGLEQDDPEKVYEPDKIEEVEELSAEIFELHKTVKDLQNSLEEESQPQGSQINDAGVEINIDDDTDIQKAWQEKAADFNLSLDEPPPELWTRIGEYGSDDDDEIEYEQGMSLQGAAYVRKREQRTNFTERLHHTLRGRQKKAEIEREQEKEKKDNHPYRTRIIILCSTLLIVLGFACAALWLVQNWLPKKLKINIHNNDGLAVRHEELKAGEELSEDLGVRSEDLSIISDDLISNDVHEISEDVETETEAQAEVKIPVTFDDFLNEGNNAYNLGLYNMAVVNFFKASELNGSDIRAYIGLAASYRAKGMFFDTKRILDEAKRRFKRNATVEVMLKILGED